MMKDELVRLKKLLAAKERRLNPQNQPQSRHSRMFLENSIIGVPLHDDDSSVETNCPSAVYTESIASGSTYSFKSELSEEDARKENSENCIGKGEIPTIFR
eukprot:13650584-Ditylum_brightwellii.AAC.1